MSFKKIIPVIMSGGAGSRLWPLSRTAKPKQLLPLVTSKTMVQETAARFDGPDFTAPVFICNALHTDHIKAQMAEEGRDIRQIIVEPMGRNTAPCAVVAACYARDLDPEALVLLVPADHHVHRPDVFRQGVLKARDMATSGRLVTFGIKPDFPETGYGYIQKGEALSPAIFDVAAFKEKPDEDTAKAYIESGQYVWNAGIFLFSPAAFLEEIEKFEPDILKQAEAAYKAAAMDQGYMLLDQESFAACPDQSIDYAVMEKTDKAAVLPFDIGWSDIGSFASLHDVVGARGNSVSGDVITIDTENCLIRTDGPLVCAVGIENLAIIVHDGQILVTRLDKSQDVRKVTQALKAQQRNDCL